MFQTAHTTGAIWERTDIKGKLEMVSVLYLLAENVEYVDVGVPPLPLRSIKKKRTQRVESTVNHSKITCNVAISF